jgi:hypothetical protein
LRFRSPSEVHRSTPAPSRGPEGPHVGRCFLSWALLPYDTSGATDPRFTGLPAPLRATSGVWVPPSRLPPSSLPTPFGAGASLGFTLQGLLLATIGTPFGAPSPRGFPASIRLAPMGSVRTRPRSGPRSRRRARSAVPGPEGPGAPMPSWASPSRALSLLVLRLRFVSRGIPSHALGGLTSQPACVSGCSGSRRSAVPSRGCRLSWVFSPYDRPGTAGGGAGGGLMVSPHGSRALQAARTDLSPLASPTRPRLSSRPGAAVHR